MKCRIIAAVWIAAATVPLLLAALFLVGCCVFPFHGVLHQVMPLCETAANVMRGDHHDGHDRDHDAVPLPAREKQEPGKRVATDVPNVFRLVLSTASARAIALSPAAAHRSFITLGAVRCDQDVGLHILAQTFRI